MYGNAKFRSNSGLKCYTNHVTDGKCCEVAGRYICGEEPRNVFRRHDNCGCTVTYENVRHRQDVWSKKSWEAPDITDTKADPVRFSGKQANELEQKNLQYKGLTNNGESGIIKEKISIGRSLSAAGKNYPVRLPDGNHTKFAEGTEITKIKVFAGDGTDTPIRDAIYLENEHKIPAKKWQKVRGEGIIIENGKRRKVEIHWYEADGNKVNMKVKRYLDEG